ncbi:MAG: Trm112 family protein [Candidatus Cloacimonetes bacterium]|jgi:uncharacterized protein YbaR (Trm112 family)|nr:Trm112 family protein [Candidatus Cloacimonadota bacterium]
MYLLLTDILTCPRCGPEFGLILLADRIEERRVLSGRLGCANCREQYAVEDGFGVLGSGWSSEPRQPDDEAVVRMAALLGITEGPGFVLLVGDAAVHAEALAGLVPNLEVIAASDTAAAWQERAGVSRIGIGRNLPFPARSLRGVVLTGDAASELLEQSARSLAPMARLVLEDAPEDAAQRLETEGLRILAQQGDTVVAVRG